MVFLTGLLGGKYKAVIRKGIYYFRSYGDARRWAIEHALDTNRFVCFGRGWAIQKDISGPYWGPEGWD